MLINFCSDVEKIQSGIGDKVALFLQYFSTFIAGFAIGFIINWKMALVVSTMLPILTTMAFLSAKVRDYEGLVWCVHFHTISCFRSSAHSLLENRVPMHQLGVLLRRCYLPFGLWWHLEGRRERQRGNSGLLWVDDVIWYIIYRYGEKLKEARNVGVRKGLFGSVLVGGIYLVVFSTYALGFWWVWWM